MANTHIFIMGIRKNNKKIFHLKQKTHVTGKENVIQDKMLTKTSTRILTQQNEISIYRTQSTRESNNMAKIISGVKQFSVEGIMSQVWPR